MRGPIALCTDSSSQLPRQLAAELGVYVVPVPVTVDGSSFEEGPELDQDWFCERLLAGASVTTSQPPPGAFGRAYEALAAAGAATILSIHVDSRVSGTTQSAAIAAAEARVPVVVVDTGTTSFGVAVCMLAAHRAIAHGAPAGRVVELVRDLAPLIENAFVARPARSGRLPARPGNPVLSFVAGAPQLLADVAELAEAPAAIAEHFARRGGRMHAAVGHAAGATAEHAGELASLLANLDSVVLLRRYRVGPSIAAHTGALSFGAFWWPAA